MTGNTTPSFSQGGKRQETPRRRLPPGKRRENDGK